MTEWDEVRLSDLADINPESTPKWPNTQLVRYVDIAAVNFEGGIAVDGIKPLAFGSAPGRARRRIRTGDVLVSTVRPNLRAFAEVPQSLDGEVASTGFAVLRGRPDVVAPGFLWCVVQSEAFVADMVAKCTGSNYPAVRAADVAAYKFTAPEPETQQKIASLMESVERLCRAKGFEIEKLRALATALRQESFGNLTEVPTVPASQMFDMLLGRQKSARQSVGDHVLPYIRAANITATGMDLGDLQTMNFEPHEQVKYGLAPGDTLLVEGGSIGQASRWKGQLAGVVGFDKHVIRLRPREGVSTSAFALQWCHWARESGAFNEQATGITIKALGFARASAMPVPDLDPDAQESLVAPLEALDATIAHSEAEFERLSLMRTTLLTSLLERSVEVDEAHHQVAGVFA